MASNHAKVNFKCGLTTYEEQSVVTSCPDMECAKKDEALHKRLKRDRGITFDKTIEILSFRIVSKIGS